MTPEQKEQLEAKLKALKVAQERWFDEQCKARKLDKAGDGNWTRFVKKQKAALRGYLAHEYRLSRLQYKHDILNG